MHCFHKWDIQNSLGQTERPTDIVLYRAEFQDWILENSMGLNYYAIKHSTDKLLRLKYITLKLVATNRPINFYSWNILLKNSLRRTDQPTDQQTDIVLYRAAIAAKNLDQLKTLNRGNTWNNSTLEPIQPLNQFNPWKWNPWTSCTLEPIQPLKQLNPWINYTLELIESLNQLNLYNNRTLSQLTPSTN